VSIQVRRYALAIVSCCLVTLFVASWSALGSAKSNPNDWLTTSALQLQKLLDLPANIQPAGRNLACASIAYHASNGDMQDCVGKTTLGTLSADGKGWYVDDTTVVPLKLNGSNSANFFPLPSSQQVMYIDYATGNNWNKVGFYTNLQRKDLAEKYIWRGWYARERQFWVSREPDYVLQDAQGKDLLVNNAVMAVSPSAHWLVADTSVGLVRVDLTSAQRRGMLFAPSLEKGVQGMSGAHLAISDDGQYVALSRTSNWGTVLPLNMAIYDLANCAAVNGENRCASRDLWNASSGWQGIAAQLPKAGKLANLRFVGNQTIRFDATYNTSGSHFDAATYLLSVVPEDHGLGLLGVGDSYISGEGAYGYIKGTNLGVNHCHQSLASYPFLLGAKLSTSYDSIACSGAIKDDIFNTNAQYAGQVHDGTIAAQRDQVELLRSLRPGYIMQRQFVQAYKPETVILSIGGNDIGFGDIVASCVAAVRVPTPFDLSSTHSTCFPAYEDRYELARSIQGKFNDLAATYQDIKDSSPATRIYVAGYPHIAQPGGNCGLNVQLDASEVQFSQDLIDYLNSVIAQAAAKAGVRYVDISHVFDGHKLCESGEKAVNGLTAGDDTLGILGSESYHPNAYGHRLLADAIARATANLTTPMPAAQNVSAPVVGDALPLLSNAPAGISGRKVAQSLHADSFAQTVWIGGQKIMLHLDGLLSNFAASGAVDVSVHSQTTHVATLATDANGTIDGTLVVPDGLAPGFHTVHLQGKDMNGNDADAWQMVYVAASQTDYDNDGIPNAEDGCRYLANTGIDSDSDGIDDGCDGVYAHDALAEASEPVVAATAVLMGSNTTAAVTRSSVATIQGSGDTTAAQPAASSATVETGQMLSAVASPTDKGQDKVATSVKALSVGESKRATGLLWTRVVLSAMLVLLLVSMTDLAIRRRRAIS